MRHRLAQLLMQMREWDQAEQELGRCLSEDPHNPEIRATWGQWLVERGQRDRAREVLQQLLADSPSHFDGHRLLGEMEFKEGRFAEALPHLKAAAQQRPYVKQARWALARALQMLGRDEEAKPHFQYVAESEKALATVDRLIPQAVSQPSDPQIRYEIGTLLLKWGPPEDGAKWLLSVLQLKPDHRRAHEALAAYYEAGGEWTIARLHREQAAGREPAPASQP
jgi:tetratricopeptide (TPR) repeat protein